MAMCTIMTVFGCDKSVISARYQRRGMRTGEEELPRHVHVMVDVQTIKCISRMSRSGQDRVKEDSASATIHHVCLEDVNVKKRFHSDNKTLSGIDLGKF
ncbi:unnamed protein product [Toxocara canis]|uniref:Secreted protein n=1 Tax=Toxocara canis TaxID=6265 RepID=A0A183UKD9_TOXCA|nr:unnamed protein product [Toxocara canis]